ncbi:MAG TPA: hypothetical protein VJN18_14805 [Polyangiaceae bacterium]|nr:hypothetical protein [Polyangiaceae bacterium]
MKAAAEREQAIRVIEAAADALANLDGLAKEYTPGVLSEGQHARLVSALERIRAVADRTLEAVRG